MSSREAEASLREAFRYNGAFWRSFAKWGALHLPEPLTARLPALVGRIIFRMVQPNREAAVENLTRILGGARGAVVQTAARTMFEEFAYCLAETFEAYSPQPPPVRVDTPEHDGIGAALNEGRGVILLTAHLGNWDVAAQALRRYERPLNLVMAHEQNRTTQEFLQEARAAAGVRVLYSDSSVLSSLNMLRVLRQNEIVAMQLDRPVAGMETARVGFFGADAGFSVGPFMLARAAGCPLIPVFAPRRGRRHYEIRVGDPLRIVRRTGGRESDVAEAMAGAVALLEQTVREFPTQWFQFQPFWR